MERPVTIGMLKDVPAKWDAERNWSVFCEQFEWHGDTTDIFVTPECYLDGYAVTEDDWTVDRFADVSLALDDPRVSDLCDMARRQQTDPMKTSSSSASPTRTSPSSPAPVAKWRRSWSRM